MVPGLRMPCGSKAALIRRMRSSLTGSSSSARKYAASRCRCRARPRWPRRARRPVAMMSREEPVADRRRRPATPTGGRCRRRRARSRRSATSRGRGQVGDRRRGRRGWTARGTTTSTMSSAPLALDTQKACSRAVTSSAPALVGQHVDVEGAELGDQLGQGLDVLLEPVGVVVLQHDHQVGQRLRPGPRRGSPRSMPALAVMPAMVTRSMYSTSSGPTPLATMRGTAAAIVVEGGERGQQRGVVVGPRVEAQGGLGDQRQGALGADDAAGSGRSRWWTSRTCPRSGSPRPCQHRLEPQHVVAGHAVLDGPHAAGVGGHVAARGWRDCSPGNTG